MCFVAFIRDTSPSFVETLIEKYFDQRGYGLTPDSVKAYCKPGKVLFLPDGLDEFPPVMRNCIVDSFAEFCLTSIRPLHL